MSIKHRIVIGTLIGVLGISHAWSTNGPASIDYVKSAMDSLRNELGSQFGNRFNEFTSTLDQLTAKTHDLTTIDNQLMSLINQLNVRLSTLTSSTSESGTNINNKIETVQNQVNELPIITYKVGDIVHGGMVFYVDASRQHGLISSLTDLGQEGIEWRNGEGGDRRVNSEAKGLGAGETNTRLIVAEQTIDEQEGQFAALLAANYQVAEDGSPCASTLSVASTCFGGWYLPSAYELMLLHANLKKTGLAELSSAAYWSSTEASATEAWLVDFSEGQAAIHNKSTPARVRAIHNF